MQGPLSKWNNKRVFTDAERENPQLRVIFFNLEDKYEQNEDFGI